MMKKRLLGVVLAATAAAIAAGVSVAPDNASADPGPWVLDGIDSAGEVIEHAGLEAEVWARRDIAGNPANFSLVVSYSDGSDPHWIDVASYCNGGWQQENFVDVTGAYDAVTSDDCGYQPTLGRGRIWDY